MSEPEYSVTGRVYQVFDGENQYEYVVELVYDGEIVDKWNSLFETYNIQNGHLTHDEAVQAVQEITQDVHDGNITEWFDLE